MPAASSWRARNSAAAPALEPRAAFAELGRAAGRYSVQTDRFKLIAAPKKADDRLFDLSFKQKQVFFGPC